MAGSAFISLPRKLRPWCSACINMPYRLGGIGHGDERFIGVVAPGQVTPEGLQHYRDAGVRHLVVRLPTVAPERLETALGELRERLVVPAQAL